MADPETAADFKNVTLETCPKCRSQDGYYDGRALDGHGKPIDALGHVYPGCIRERRHCHSCGYEWNILGNG
jgi:hypothetical protein